MGDEARTAPILSGSYYHRLISPPTAISSSWLTLCIARHGIFLAGCGCAHLISGQIRGRPQWRFAPAMVAMPRGANGPILGLPCVVTATDRIGGPNSRTREAHQNEPRPPAKYDAPSAKDQARGHSARYRRGSANRRRRL